MADKFEGHVLRGARVSPANARSTAEPTTGVIRFPKTVPPIYDGASEAPEFVDAFADQYRAGLLDAPGSTTNEYLVWAQNTGSLAMVEDPSWWVEEGHGAIPQGTLTVDNTTPEGDEPLTYEDGADRVVVVDDGNRSIGFISTIVIARGDVDYDDDGWSNSNDPTAGRDGNPAYLTFVLTAADQNPQSGIVRLTAAQLVLLDGGLSVERGDRIVTVTYTLSPVKFYWTRNDRYQTRFGWNGSKQRWEPLKGSTPTNLGILLVDETYQMEPKVTNLPINAYLPGDGSNSDSYSMIRLGADPGAGSTPVGPGDPNGFTGIQVKADDVVDEGFDFSTAPSLTGVMGQTTGVLSFNPTYVQLHAGKTIWFSYKNFEEDADGIVGPLYEADINPLFIAPIPGPTDAPLLRIGSRRYLAVTLADDDAELAALPTPGEGEVAVSLSTGRLKLSPDDTAKADPDNTLAFSKYYLGNDIIYDGVALNQVPQPTKAPVALVNQSGSVTTADSGDEFYVPPGVTLPEEFAATDTYRGLGRSGILDAPDGTGSLPVQPTLRATVRPGGDTLSDLNTGRIRMVEDGVGDTIIFSRTRSVTTVYPRDTVDDLPGPSYKVRRGRAYVARQATDIAGEFCSRVSLSKSDLRAWGNNEIYFLQSTFTPATYTLRGRLFSKSRDIFRFDGTEILYFAIDGQLYQWASSNLTGADFYTATEVAASITADSTQVPGPGTGLITGSCYEKNGRVVIGASDETLGTVEIGWGLGGVKDLSGAAVLGFMPGWRAVGGVTNWLPDGGTAMGMFRSPLNLDRTRATPDFRDTERLEGEILQDSIQGTPFQFLDNPPLLDVAGLDEGIFFSLSTIIDDGISVTIVQKLLEHYDDIVYRFGQSKFDWVARNSVSESVEAAVSSLDLQNAGVVPESLLGAPEIGGGLYVSEAGGAATFQEQDADYLLPQDGTPGIAVLVEKFGNRIDFGARGSLTASSDIFTDDSDDVDFSNVPAGYRLKVLSGGEPIQGSYIVSGVVGPKSLLISPTPLETPERLVTWELYEGLTEDVYDPSIVADVIYKEFNHLSEEPFEVKLLSPVGPVPENFTEQENSRLFAYMEGALASNRSIAIRYGLTAATATNTASMIELTQTELGTLANNALDVPETDSQRFTTGSFSIKVGTALYENDGVLLKEVATFSVDPAGGDGIEYLAADTSIDGVLTPAGRLKFGSNILTEFSSSVVTYVQAFQPPTDLAELTVEFTPWDGVLNFSATDMGSFAGTQAYFVEQMITVERKDVSINPLLGAFSFKQPLTTNSSVEVSYWAADLEGRKVGDQITEFLPVFIRDEEALSTTPGEAGTTFYFNVDPRRTVDTRIEPVVYIGPVMQNYNALDYVLDYPDFLNGQGRLSFTRAIPSHVTVKVSYAVLEALGGEKAYESSLKPCYRPPFFIEANQERFGLRGNRVDEFEAGQLLRIGSESYYIESAKYYTDADVTAVYIFPHTTNEVGSRSPGNDLITVISDRPLTTVVDPDGNTPVPTTASPGLMSTIDTQEFPFQPINRGQTEVVFLGNLTEFAVPGHIIEVRGEPHTISQVELSEDGTRTIITVTAGFKTGTSMDEEPTVKLSYRPLYPPQTAEFLGVGPMVTTEPYELVLYGERDLDGNLLPGRTLIETIEYELDPDTGNIKLLEPLQGPLGTNQKLTFMFTRLRLLQPFWEGGTVSFPRYVASYLYISAPSRENAILGGQLLGTFTFRTPDSFYYRVVPMPQFLVEAAQEAVNDITSREPAGGSILTSGGGQDNWEQGRIGLKSERSHLENQDRAARAFLDFYNSSVISFEQINETISGGFIGDRDGKFRFWVGRGLDYPTPGYEDDISGQLTRRNIWSEVFNQADPDAELFYLTTDWIVTPGSQTMSDGVISGSFPDPDRIDRLMDQQHGLIQNDVDDFVMTSLAKPKVTFKLRFPFFFYKVKGRFRTLYQRSRFSRIFPTETRAFMMSYPGVGGNQETEDPATWDAGRYTYGRMFFGNKKRTTGKTIGQLRNPAHGDIDRRVSTAKLTRRRARARIWGYFPNGIPAFSFQGGTQPLADITDPCVIAFPALLRDVPIDPSTGFPDDSQLISQGYGLSNPDAWLPDPEAGDPDLIVPGFVRGNEISLGRPDNTTYDTYFNEPITVNIFDPEPTYTGLYVHDILYGCVIRFEDRQGNKVSNPNDILVGTSPSSGVPFSDFPVVAHDTIFAGPPLKKMDVAFPTDPVTTENIQELAQGLDDYRTGFDVTVKSDGRVVDKTWPSFHDPSFFGIKEIFGQHPPDPLDYLEATVQFYYDGQNPFEFPALRGETTDDSGDYQIPYIKAANTEMDRFDEAMVGISPVMTAVDPGGDAVYPDEILGTDGTVVGVIGAGWLQSSPAALLTEANLAPAPGTGLGDARRYDLLLIQNEGTSPFETAPGSPTEGPMGIQSIGDVTISGTDSKVEPPRFITQTTAATGASSATGSPVRYTFTNAMAFADGGPGVPGVSPGVHIIEDSINGITRLDFDTVQLVLNDGATPVPAWPGIPTGNLNSLWALLPNVLANNIIRIHLISRPDPNVNFGPPGPNPDPPPTKTGGLVALTIEIQGGTITVTDYQGNVTVTPIIAPIAFGSKFPVPDPAPAANQEIIIPQTGLLPWGPVPPGLESQWFLPYQIVGGENRMLYGFEFAIDIETDTLAGGQSNTCWIDDDRLTFHEVFDMRQTRRRGYVHPVSGLPMEGRLVVNQITTWHPSVGAMWSRINGGVNGYNFLLQPYPLTFLAPTTPVDPDSAGGTWNPAAPFPVPTAFERGTIRAMSFEGDNNQPITTTAGRTATFTAIPSNEEDENGTILNGTGETASKFNTDLSATQQEQYDDRLTNLSGLTGDIDNVESGDIVVIRQNSNAAHHATTKAGTYVVRHAVKPTTGNYRETSSSTVVGTENGWCPVHFPRIVSFDDTGPYLLTLTDLAPARGGGVVGGKSTGFDTFLAGQPRLYIIRDVNGLTSSDEDTFRQAVISARYTAINAAGDEPVFTIDTFKDAQGTALTLADFTGLIEGEDYQVSGMVNLPVNVSGASYGLPDNNCVGDDTVANTVYGFRYVTFRPNQALADGGAIDLLFDGAVAGPGGISKATALGNITPVVDATLERSYEFYEDRLTPVYNWVVHTLNITTISQFQWDNLNAPIAPPAPLVAPFELNCILPNTTLALANLGGALDGHYAQAGLFLEPSVPRSALELEADHARVVDADHDLTDPSTVIDPDRENGMRNAQFYAVGAVVLNGPEQVQFEVRRIRRWHEIQEEADSNLKPLQYAYEIRRGRIKGYSTTDKQRGLLTAADFVMNWNDESPARPHAQDAWNDGHTYSGTNLGPFDDEDVNIHSGDVLRLLDVNGDLVEQVSIESIKGPDELALSAPGLQTDVADLIADGGMRFEIYLRRAPVPHEQSNEQLLELITDREVHRTTADWGTADEKGGYVPDMEAVPWEDAANRLMDDLNAPTGSSFSALGIQKGDIVIVDPIGRIPRGDAGLPSTRENSARPIGDDGVEIRTAPAWVAGYPDTRDDNRGYYRVKRVMDTASPPYLEMDPVSTYSGDASVGGDVIFGTSVTNDREYAVYPTVNDSHLRKFFVPADVREGQMDLRPTYHRDAVTGSFSLYTGPDDHFKWYSIRPFSYRVIRPSGLFSDEAIDLVLMMRERMLSWIEMIRALIAGFKSGSYFVFQRDTHISDLGNTTNPQAGLGLLSNDYITSILGRLDIVPYANNESCLSLLDRRFWIQDWRLDFLTTDPANPLLMLRLPPGGTAYTAYNDFTTGGVVRPVLPERVDEVLDTRDRFRPIRFVWLAYRTHVILGTLASIERFDEELPKRLEEQRRLLLLEDSVEGIG